MVRRPPSAFREFLSTEAAGGIVLMAAAAMAMLVANGPLGADYAAALGAHLGPLSVLHWINDGLMALFFLLVGLEVKRELIDGQLSRPAQRALPAIVAAAGMAVPAGVYLAVAGGTPGLARGWAIPAATDIAFAVGVLALLGRGVPAALKLLLTAVAIVDDMGAVAIIALAYTETLDLAALGLAAGLLAALVALNRAGVQRFAPYLVLGAALWAATLASGIHATLAGVLLALTIPLRRSPARPDDAGSPLHRLEHALHGPVAFLVVPLFGFANAGVSLAGVDGATLLAPLTLAVALGLFVGKQAGVMLALWGAARLRLASLPSTASWTQLWGVALLCGIGFTMSLFIGGLAFDDPVLGREVKLGVLGGSLASAVAGYVVLRRARTC